MNHIKVNDKDRKESSCLQYTNDRDVTFLELTTSYKSSKMMQNARHKEELDICFTLHKHAHGIYRDFFGCKKSKLQWIKIDILNILAQNIDCEYTLEPPRRGGSNEYPQSMFWTKNKKDMYTLHTPVLLCKSGV